MEDSTTQLDQSSARKGKIRLAQYLAATTVSVSSFATGVVMGWPSTMLPLLQSSPSPLGDDVEPMSADSSSWLGSLMCFGGILSSPFYNYMVNRHSRKLTGYLVGLSGVIGWLLVLTARSELMLFAGRLFLGLGAAGSSIMGPLYVTEIVDDDIRGSLVSYTSLFASSGILFAYVVGYYASYTTFTAICLAMPVIFMASFFWMPETPVYLISQNNPDGARKDASSEISANVSTIIIGALQMFGIYLMIILIDRAGRKILLIVSNVVSSACLAALGGFFYLKANGHDVTHLGWLPVTSLGMYIVTIALGVNSIPFVVINEIFNPQMRGFGVALFMCLLNVMAFLVTRFFTDLNNLLGLDGCYWFFAVCLVTMALFCYFIVPETKNKSLDSILKELAGEEVTLQKADESLEGSV